MNNYNLPKKYKILNFNQNFFNLKKHLENPFILYYEYNKYYFARIGCLIKKTQIQSACKRNFIKRIIREKFRIYKKKLYNYDLIISITKIINSYKFKKINFNIKINKILNFLINKNTIF